MEKGWELVELPGSGGPTRFTVTGGPRSARKRHYAVVRKGVEPPPSINSADLLGLTQFTLATTAVC